ncbi:hypothetical protein K491DRAFT_248038 [Lophiostoma macrostomum CBS 122681]|uniref:Uncharacterized protein n=1 Tax=Lophiostoma macrostomum CBS 122681 TaxID=1314788 RepID=A0A6A6SPC6_9PLEO|nr:hypothetical protein K491DRAFT_248038 [Lophiostoma macrostomum CBS 122681]
MQCPATLSSIDESQVDDQDPFQPGNAFKHCRAWLRAPPIHQTNLIPRNDGASYETSAPPGGADDARSKTPFRRKVQDLQSTSPSIGVANVGIRRSDRSSILLSSPARMGHSSRMRDIFENASLGHTRAFCDDTISYPRLPNISRAYSRAPSHRSNHHLPLEDTSTSASGFMSAQVSGPPQSEHRQSQVQRLLKYSPSGSSGSCSTVATEEVEQASSLAYDTAQTHITEWLSTIAPNLSLDQHMSSPPATYPVHPMNKDHTICRNSGDDEYVHTPRLLRSDDQGCGLSGIGKRGDHRENSASPLSPSVCIERGPCRRQHL